MSDLFLQPQHISVEWEGLLYVPRIYGRQRADGMWEGWIEFYPTGRAWPAHVRITLDDGSATDIACESPAEEFRLITNSGGRS